VTVYYNRTRAKAQGTTQRFSIPSHRWLATLGLVSDNRGGVVREDPVPTATYRAIWRRRRLDVPCVLMPACQASGHAPAVSAPLLRARTVNSSPLQ
jgi:hypothetical protein